jgi:hypothetical protein
LQPTRTINLSAILISPLQRNFLETYTTRDTERIFEKVIDEMCGQNGQSLSVSYLYLTHHSPVLAIWIADAPKQVSLTARRR